MKSLPLQWSVDINKVSRTTPAIYSYEAGSGELEAIKDYAGIEDLTNFKAQVEIAALAGGRFRVSGTLSASLVQASVVDLKAVPSHFSESFSVEYWPAEALGGAEGDAVPFDADPPEPIAGGRIPIGELLCELFLVSIDPYPRNEGDSFEWKPARNEPEASPFAGLAQLRPGKDRVQD
jgi:hypothetical protein